MGSTQSTWGVKRVLTDSQSNLGEEYSLSNFIYENDKCRGRAIQNTVQSNVADHIAAGGHQGYASLGALYSQARPMLPNLYGDVVQQTEGAPGHGKINVLPGKKNVIQVKLRLWYLRKHANVDVDGVMN